MRVPTVIALAAMMLLVQRAPARSAVGNALSRNAVSDFVTEASHRFAIPERWIYAVMRVESAGDPRAVSPKGAAGLMQIMPATWRQLQARYALGDDIYDPHDNIIAGAGYLRELYDRYGSPGFLAAYNAGPGRYESYLARGTSLPDETVAYVRKLVPITATETRQTVPFSVTDKTAWTRSALFAGTSGNSPAATAASSVDARSTVGVAPRADAVLPPAASSLFIPLSGQSRR